MFRPIHGHHQVLHVHVHVHVGLILPQSPTVGPTYLGRRTTPRLPHDDILPRQKTPASPEQHIVLIPYPLFSPIAYRHYITETDVKVSKS